MKRNAGPLAALVTVVILTIGCVPGGGNGGAVDAAGMTPAQVSALTLEEEFDLFGERYSHMQGLLEEAQLQISDGP